MAAIAHRFSSLHSLLLLFLSPVATAAPAPAPELELDLVRPGTFGIELHGSFGDPIDSRRELEPHLWIEELTRPDAGYERVTVWYDPEGFVSWARVILVNRLEPATAALLFDLRSGAKRSDGHVFSGGEEGHCLHHHGDGVHFHVRDGRVEEIWRTAPDSDLEALRKAAQATWPPRSLPAPEEVIAETDTSEGGSIIDLEEYFGGKSGGEEELDVSGAGDLGELLGTEFPFTPTPTVRTLGVGGLEVHLELDADRYPILRVVGPVVAHGFNGKQVTFEGFLSRVGAGGAVEYLLAGPSAPPEYRAPSGQLRPQAHDTVRFDQATWEAAALVYPLRWVQGLDPSRISGTFVVSLEVRCDGFAAYSSAPAYLPGPDLVATAIPARVLAGGFRWEEGEVEGHGPGLWIYRALTVVGAKELTIASQTTLRTLTGEPVRAAQGHDAWRSANGSFYSMATDRVLHEESSWDAYRNFVPFGALDLPPGEHSLILRDQCFVPPLGTAQETTITLSIPRR